MKNFQFQLFVGACLLLTVQSLMCPPSIFVELSTGKYFFSPIKASWINSWRFCRLLGANLVSIETLQEQQALVNHIKSSETFVQTTDSTTKEVTTTAGAALVNLALKKVATLSSTFRNSEVQYGASNAVDGAGFECDCNEDNCTISEMEETPWWQVDLGRDYKVHNVSLADKSIWGDILHDFEVRIGDKPAPNHGSNTLCGSHVGMGMGIVDRVIYNITCKRGPITGRYVTVQITRGSENYLTLCEVQVLGETAVQRMESSTMESTTTSVDRPSVSYWTSGIKMFQDKKWIWMSTGNAIEYTAWCRDQPNNEQGVQDCLHFNFEDGGCWKDFYCASDSSRQQEIRFICEVDNMIH